MSYDPNLTANNDPFLPPLEARNTTSAYYPGVPTSSNLSCASAKPGWSGLYHQLLPPPSMPSAPARKDYSTVRSGREAVFNKIAINMRLLFVNHIVSAFPFFRPKHTYEAPWMFLHLFFFYFTV
jgi:hypothetical protein